MKGTDEDNDVAVVGVSLASLSDETKSSIRAIAIGDSDSLRMGEGVIAIGNALGFGPVSYTHLSSNLARFDGVKYGYRTEEYEGLHNMYKKTRSEGFGPEVKRRIMLGSFVLSSGYYDAYYLKALRTKALIKQEFDRAFERFDVILAPAAPTTAPKLGESLANPLQMYLGDIYTISVNLAGLPGISVPCGTDAKGLPIGVQTVSYTHLYYAYMIIAKVINRKEKLICVGKIIIKLDAEISKDINDGDYIKASVVRFDC